jgi:hypothetical protein
MHHAAPPFAAAAGTIAVPGTSPEARAERPTLSGMAPENFAETLLKGPALPKTGRSVPTLANDHKSLTS